MLVVKGNVASALRGFLNDLHADWPEMLVAISGADDEGRFSAWAADLELPDSGDVLIARDQEMVRAWDDTGYVLTDGREGPIAVYYSGGPSTLRVQLPEDPYARDGFRFSPYEAILAGSGLSLVTAVTPPMDAAFSQRVVASLVGAFAAI